MESEASLALAGAVLAYDKDVLMWDFYCLSDVTAYGLEMFGMQKIPDWLERVIMPTRFQPVDYEVMQVTVGIYMKDRLWRKVNPLSQYQWYVTKGDADQDRAN